MDWTYISKIGLSALIFAPGLLILVACLFVGILMLLEKAGVLKKSMSINTKPTVEPNIENPKPGPIVEGLKKPLETRQQAVS